MCTMAASLEAPHRRGIVVQEAGAASIPKAALDLYAVRLHDRRMVAEHSNLVDLAMCSFSCKCTALEGPA